MGMSLAVMASAWLVCGIGIGPNPTDAPSFEGWFRGAVAGRLDIPPDVARQARGFRYIFVGGFRGERMPAYFADNITELVALGIPRRQIHVVRPGSDKTSEGNAEMVREAILAIAAEGPEPLVLVGHSRGACDALAFALGDPDFVEHHIRALFLIQGPFGGSGLAGHVTGSGVVPDQKMRWNHRLVAGLAGRLARALARPEWLEAMGGMTPEASATFWSKALDRDGRTLTVVGSRAFFIRSAIHPSRQRFPRRALAWYLQTYHGAGDGVVALDDQSIPGFGTIIATLEAGHSDLTIKPSRRDRRWDRRALGRTIVMAVGGSVLEPVPAFVLPSDQGRRRGDLRVDRSPEGEPGLQRGRRREVGVTPASRVVEADRR